MITVWAERQALPLPITLARGVILAAPPSTASIATGKSARAAITFVSPATRIDPKIQGMSFLYAVPADSVVLRGMNVLAFFPSGHSMQAPTVPASAPVWWQGAARG